MLYAHTTSDLKEVIYSGDPAVSPDSDIDAYQIDLDQEHLLLDGVPTIFLIGPLSTMQASRATRQAVAQRKAEGGDDLSMALFYQYFRFGVREIRNLEEEGDVVKIKGSRGMSDDVFNKLPPMVSQGIINEIGGYIIVMTKGLDADALAPGEDEAK